MATASTLFRVTEGDEIFVEIGKSCEWTEPNGARRNIFGAHMISP